jgi:hypothetical protein
MRCERSLAGLAVAAAMLAGGTAHAQDAFEIQVYDAETAPPGTVGAELHVNNFVVGRREPTDDGELPTHHMTHLTIEPHIGIARWCEAGGYIQTAVRGDGTFDFAGVKLRFKARIPRRLKGIVGLSLNTELSSVPQEYEAARFGWELRPIVDVAWRRLYFSINPILSMPLGGPLAGHPGLEPAVKLSVRVASFLAIGPEYYASFGPLDRPEPLAGQTHRLFAALDFQKEWGRVKFDANIAGGYGFTGEEKWIVKAIFAIDYERLFTNPEPPKPEPPPAAATGS